MEGGKKGVRVIKVGGRGRAKIKRSEREEWEGKGWIEHRREIMSLMSYIVLGLNMVFKQREEEDDISQGIKSKLYSDFNWNWNLYIYVSSWTTYIYFSIKNTYLNMKWYISHFLKNIFADFMLTKCVERMTECVENMTKLVQRFTKCVEKMTKCVTQKIIFGHNSLTEAQKNLFWIFRVLASRSMQWTQLFFEWTVLVPLYFGISATYKCTATMEVLGIEINCTLFYSQLIFAILEVWTD